MNESLALWGLTLAVLANLYFRVREDRRLRTEELRRDAERKELMKVTQASHALLKILAQHWPDENIRGRLSEALEHTP